MRRSRCWWACSSNFDKIGKTQHFSTFLDISQRVEVATGGTLYIGQECRESFSSILPRGEVGDDVDGALRGEETTTFCFGVCVVEESRGSSSKQSDTVARHMNVKSRGGANPVPLSACSSMLCYSIQYSSARQLSTSILKGIYLRASNFSEFR